MSQQPQGPGWWRASDGRWYPPQRPAQQPLPPRQPFPQQQPFQQQPFQPVPRSAGNRGCVIAAVVVVAVLLIGAGIAAYLVISVAQKVSDVATGAGTATCPTEQDVSAAVGSAVTLEVQGSVIVASGCSYLAVDRASGADVQITTGLALVADEQIASFVAEAGTQDATPEPIPVGERGQAYGGDRKSAAIAVSDGKLVEVEVYAAGSPIGDRTAAAVILLTQVIVTG